MLSAFGNTLYCSSRRSPGEEDAALEMCPCCPAHPSPVSAEAAPAAASRGAVTRKGLRVWQGPGQMPAGTPTEAPLHSTAAAGAAPAAPQPPCRHCAQGESHGLLGLLAGTSPCSSTPPGTPAGAQANLHSPLLPPPCAQQTEATHACLLDVFTVEKPSSTFDLAFRGQSACSDSPRPF